MIGWVSSSFNMQGLISTLQSKPCSSSQTLQKEFPWKADINRKCMDKNGDKQPNPWLPHFLENNAL